jgi:hypothetical protein
VRPRRAGSVPIESSAAPMARLIFAYPLGRRKRPPGSNVQPGR